MEPSRRRPGRGRRYRRAAPTTDTAAPPVRPVEGIESWRAEDWFVRRITGAASTKPYRCPGCDQQIRPATPHVVVWPVEPSLAHVVGGGDPDGLAERRHWHTPCWTARDQRSPR